MKRVATPVGGMVPIVPFAMTNRSIGLAFRADALSEAQKEATLRYLFDEGFPRAAAGIINPDPKVERMLMRVYIIRTSSLV